MTSQDPRDIHSADVYKGGVLAASLSRVDGAVEFTYRADYLAGPAKPSVATTLPLSEEPRRTLAGAVPAYFAGLLPEGRRLTALRQRVKTSADDEFSLLIAAGSDPVGDVQIVPRGDPLPAITAPGEGQSDWDDVDFADLLERAGFDPATLAGVQDKVSGRMITVPLSRGGQLSFLKLTPPEYPFVVESEAFFLDAARRLRQPVVDTHVVHDRAGRAGLLVTRYDRVVDASGEVRRLPVEDATQLLDRYPADKYAVSAEEVAEAVSRQSLSQPVALLRVFTQFTFAWATGNGDLHAKNVSLVGGDLGGFQVAPTYDIPSTLPYRDHTMALPLSGRREGLSRKAFLQYADRIGLPSRSAERALAEVLHATEDLADRVSELPFDARHRRDLARGLVSRRRSLMP